MCLSLEIETERHVYIDRKTKKTNLQHVFLKTERQKKQILFDIKGPCQGVRKNKAYTGLHAIIKEEKPKKTKRKYTKIEARKQQGPKIKAQKTKYVLYVFMSSETPTENMSFMSLCLLKPQQKICPLCLYVQKNALSVTAHSTKHLS